MTLRIRKFQSRDGRMLAVRTSGNESGIPIAFLHGQMHTGRCWTSVMESDLVDRYFLFAPDMAGHGEADSPHSATDTYLAHDFADICEELDAERPVIVAWSFGSVVACNYIREGGDTRGLVLVGAGDRGPFSARLDPEQLRLNLAAMVAYLDATKSAGTTPATLFQELLSSDSAVAEAAADRMVDACRLQALDPGRRALMIEDSRKIPVNIRAAIFGTPYDNTDVYKSYTGRLLQIHGAHDALRPADTARDRAHLFQTGTTEIWDNSGHAPFDDEPERFVRTLDEFCMGFDSNNAPTPRRCRPGEQGGSSGEVCP